MNEKESGLALVACYVTHEGWEYTTIHSLPSLRIILSDICAKGFIARDIYKLCKERANSADVFIIKKSEWRSRSGLHSLHSAGVAPVLSTAKYDIFIFRQIAFVGSEKPRDLDYMFMRAVAKLTPPIPQRVGYFAWRTARGFHELELVEPLPPREAAEALAHFIVPKTELDVLSAQEGTPDE